MNYTNRKGVLSILVVITLFLASCTKDWEEHYNEDNFDLPEYSLFDYIQSQSSLSTFASMLHSTGYDSILNASQTFTVWAPTNDALANVDLNNAGEVLDIVQNQIARNRYSVSTVVSKSIRMLSGKYIEFSNAGGEHMFGNYAILDADQPTKNGLVHTIDNYIPYIQNIWEFIESGVGIDSLTNYINEQTVSKFRPDLSTEIDVNEDGNYVYDSVFVITNLIMERIGALAVEDTSYTVLLPDNNAWSTTYTKLEQLYNVPEIFGGEPRKRELVKWGIVKDMAYHGLIDDPYSYDSILSTTGTVFYNPGPLFDNANKIQLSNGLAYVTSDLAFPDTTSWVKEIRVEAENTRGRETANANIFTRSNHGMGISSDRYILIEPTGTSNIALPSVTFQIPNTLSTSYNIYCVFVPSSFSNPNDLLPMKAKFVLTYLRQSSGRTSRKTFSPDVDETDPFNLTKLFVGQFDFEFANIVDQDYSDVAVTLEVTSNVKIEEADTYNRSMRIDCIILEPVVQ